MCLRVSSKWELLEYEGRQGTGWGWGGSSTCSVHLVLFVMTHRGEPILTSAWAQRANRCMKWLKPLPMHLRKKLGKTAPRECSGITENFSRLTPTLSPHLPCQCWHLQFYSVASVELSDSWFSSHPGHHLSNEFSMPSSAVYKLHLTHLYVQSRLLKAPAYPGNTFGQQTDTVKPNWRKPCVKCFSWIINCLITTIILWN